MNIKDYLNYTDDVILDMESMSGDNNETINKTVTKFGNVFYWQMETGKIVYAEWQVPKDNRIDKLNESELDKISGEYYLKSYGENMRRVLNE